MTMTLRDIQNSWNALVPIAVARGIDAQVWNVLPQTRDRGLRRLNWLRQQLGIPVPTDQVEFEHSPGASLPPIREIVDQYNALVPEAQRRGIGNVRLWTGLPSTSLRGMQRLQWLRKQLGQTVSPVTIATVVEGIAAFDALTFGLEIECKMPIGLTKEDMANALTEAGVPCRVSVYGHSIVDHWKIVTDGSLNDYAHGIEVVSPPLHGEAGFRALRTVCAVLVAKRCKITARCGLHVHVGWKGGTVNTHLWSARTLRNLVKLYKRYEPVINSLLAPSRRDNGFCRGLNYTTNVAQLETAETWQQIVAAINQSLLNPRHGDRYRKLNLKSLGTYGTVEFRQHQGTIDSDKVEHWLRLVLRMVLAANNMVAMEVSGGTPTFDDLKNAIGLASDETRHFQGRINGFERRAASARRRELTRMERWSRTRQTGT
jgi:hypothetical protein